MAFDRDSLLVAEAPSEILRARRAGVVVAVRYFYVEVARPAVWLSIPSAATANGGVESRWYSVCVSVVLAFVWRKAVSYVVARCVSVRRLRSHYLGAAPKLAFSHWLA
ncbi:MAG: hypothetical protein R3F37_04545 [Candidatus Competibacteraceae bacterium]